MQKIENFQFFSPLLLFTFYLLIIIQWVKRTKVQFAFKKRTFIYMEFRKMVTIILYARQQKRHRCIEQFFGLCGRGRGWDDLGEWHWNMYNIICEMNRQSRFDSWYRMLGAGALGWPRGWDGEGGRRGVQHGEHMYTHGWFMSMYSPNHYNIVK